MRPDRSPDLLHEALLAVMQRARGGLAIHVVMWAMIGWATDLWRQHGLFFWAVFGCFVVNSTLRLLTDRTLRARARTDPVMARRLFLMTLLLNPALWGVIGASTVLWPDLETARLAIWFTLAGLAGSGGIPMAFDAAVRYGYPALTLLPAMFAGLTRFQPGYLFPLVAGLVYLLYIWRASKTVHTDYWTGAQARAELERRAAAFERASSTDALTQVHNRFHFDRQLVIEWARARREASPLALLMVDLDHFKRLNDEHGHAYGDECLKMVAHALDQTLHRPTDLMARYGGEEFVALLLGTDAAGAARVAERMRRAVAHLHPPAGNAKPVSLTCSIGVCCIAGAQGTEARQALAEADRALYQAKTQGRDRVVLTDLQTGSSSSTVDDRVTCA